MIEMLKNIKGLGRGKQYQGYYLCSVDCYKVYLNRDTPVLVEPEYVLEIVLKRNTKRYVEKFLKREEIVK